MTKKIICPYRYSSGESEDELSLRSMVNKLSLEFVSIEVTMGF